MTLSLYLPASAATPPETYDFGAKLVAALAAFALVAALVLAVGGSRESVEQTIEQVAATEM